MYLTIIRFLKILACNKAVALFYSFSHTAISFQELHHLLTYLSFIQVIVNKRRTYNIHIKLHMLKFVEYLNNGSDRIVALVVFGFILMSFCIFFLFACFNVKCLLHFSSFIYRNATKLFT